MCRGDDGAWVRQAAGAKAAAGPTMAKATANGLNLAMFCVSAGGVMEIWERGPKLWVDACDENTSKNEQIGSAEFSFERLLRNYTLEKELFHQRNGAGSYITFMCMQLHNENTTDGGNKCSKTAPEKGGKEVEVADSNSYGPVANDNNDQHGGEGDVLPPLQTPSPISPSFLRFQRAVMIRVCKAMAATVAPQCLC